MQPHCDFEVLLTQFVRSKTSLQNAGCYTLGLIAMAYPTIWAEVLTSLPKNHWIHQAKEVTVTIGLLSNRDIKRLNQTYRHKNEATDVLSFPGMDSESLIMGILPVLDLGEIDVSLEWALAAVTSLPETCYAAYVLDRVIHGTLHVLGVHHDTLSAYNKVVRIQADILGKLGYLRP